MCILFTVFGGYLKVVKWADRLEGNNINSRSIMAMKSESAKEGQKGAVECELRRSCRQRRQPKNDDYFMGSAHIEDLLGYAYLEEDTYPKRRRKNYRYDDSDDYSEGHKNAKKSKHINSNKVEALLEWKFQLDMLPITVNYLPQETQAVALQDFHLLKLSKHIAAENLSAIAEDIQAVFINIDWGKKGQTIKEFHQLKLQSSKFMSKGLVFVWAPKEHVSEMLTIMEKKDFTYVENFQIINFDIQKAKAHAGTRHKRSNVVQEDKKEDKTENSELDFSLLIKSLENANPCDLMADERSEFFNVSKRTLLMFKKNSNIKFQLRHQRTCDVVFDMPLRLGEKCEPDLKSYIYNMIETLLPDCLTVNQTAPGCFEFKMMELWADRDQYHRGWISVVQE